MNGLIWKEFRENLKWAVLPALLILCPMVLFGVFPLMEKGTLFLVSLFAAAFGAALGFLQVFFESRGDKRSLLLHRPLSPTWIFLAKAIAGVALYLLALGLPFACAVALAATPGHIDEPFQWKMTLPWLADSLTGLVYYFAGMLTAQREARWYGSRCLGLAAGLGCSYLVWTLPEFWHALLAIALLGGTVALAAWGSFLAGGAYAPQPRLARIALAVAFLAGLSALSFTGKLLIGLGEGNSEYEYILDRQGRVLLEHREDGRIVSVTDLEGRVPQELQGKRLDDYTLGEVQGPSSGGRFRSCARTRSYRNPGRFLMEFGNESKPGYEKWWYVPDQGRLLGYDRDSKRFVGSYGPEGYCPPDEQPRERFRGELLSGFSIFYLSWVDDYLVYADGVYTVDFNKRTVQTLFTPPAGETVLWAAPWKDKDHKESGIVVATDQSVQVLNEAGSRVFSAPRAYDLERYRVLLVRRMEETQRYRVTYEPRWHLEPEALETLPTWVVEYDGAGREFVRLELPARPQTTGAFYPPIPLADPSYAQVGFGLVTPPAEAAGLVGSAHYLFSDFRSNGGKEMWLLLQFLSFTTTYFIPGAGWNMRPDGGLVFGYTALMLVSASVCALVCFLLARRYSFPRAWRLGWALCGFVFGPTGLLLMLALQEWPARIPCPSCRRRRRVDRDRCEHCGAAHALPAADGTEIFEEVAADLQPA